MIKLSEISYREEDWSETIGDRYLVTLTFEDNAYTVAAYEKMGGEYNVPDTKLRYGDLTKAKKRFKDLVRKYTKMTESMKLKIKESSDNYYEVGDAVGINVHDDYDSIIVYCNDINYLTKLETIIHGTAEEWFDLYGSRIERGYDRYAVDCFDFILEKIRWRYRDFKYEVISGSGITEDDETGVDIAVLRDGTKVEIVGTIDLDAVF